MESIKTQLGAIERNIEINSSDPIALHGFTQMPNFILRDATLTVGAKTVYALFLSYGWHNDRCFPGQKLLAEHMGMGIASVNRFIKELEDCALIEIKRRGQGKTNIYKINFVVQKRKA
jgi:hypothetical protein